MFKVVIQDEKLKNAGPAGKTGLVAALAAPAS
jgi:hypothetical protein